MASKSSTRAKARAPALAVRPTLSVDRGTGDPVSLGAALLSGKKVRPDATLLLTQDHREAMAFMDWIQASDDPTVKAVVAAKLCAALRAHMQIEEEIFYPAAREATGDEELVEHGIKEHQEARALVEAIESASVGSREFDSALSQLRSAIADHVEDEEHELFPEVRATGLDLYELGRGMAARKVELLFELTGRDGPAEAEPKESDKMAIAAEEARDLFVTGLKDVHAAVRQGRRMVENQIERLESYPQVEERLRAHMDDKNAQLKRVEEILESLGEKRSALKDMGMSAAGSLSTMMTAATDDEILKNSLASFGLASFNAASFESLVVLGSLAGEKEAVRKLQDCLSEERAMSAWLAENMRGVIHMYLQNRSEGRQASH